ncbi:MAG: tetratricopeptide repeat protein [Candidatus Heimdallarchaeota archaeon]|nr:tetratricopeptide repeat protein [Candidatus Heimdallarchaeota archaeon]
MPKINPKEEAAVQYLKGKNEYASANFDEAFLELQKALQFYKNSTENVILADIYRILAEILFNKGNLIESRNYYKRAYQAFKNFGNKIGMADSYDQVAVSFMMQDEYQYAEEYQTKAIEIRRSTGDKKGLARGLKNLAVIAYKKETGEEKALDFLEEALDLAQRSKEPQLVINIAFDQVKILNKLGLFEAAMKSFMIARRFSKKYSITLPNEHETEFGNLLLNYGLQKYDQGDLDNALKYLKNAILVFKSTNNSLAESIDSTIQKIVQLLSKRK